MNKKWRVVLGSIAFEKFDNFILLFGHFDDINLKQVKLEGTFVHIIIHVKLTV